MRYELHLLCGLGFVATLLSNPSDALAQSVVLAQHGKSGPAGQIPQSLQVEHRHIHEALTEATRAAGRVGVAARALAAVLHPHFEREEQIALPPLGLLGPLSAGAAVDPGMMSAALAMSDSLRAELPRMLEEHTAIRAAVLRLKQEARAVRSAKYEKLADELAMHAQTEEEVLYPAAVLVGDLIRACRRTPGAGGSCRFTGAEGANPGRY
jgi:hypothetical protein